MGVLFLFHMDVTHVTQKLFDSNFKKNLALFKGKRTVVVFDMKALQAIYRETLYCP